MSEYTHPEVLTAGLAFGESPRWHDGRLWVSDWGTRQLLVIDRDGVSDVHVRVESLPFSFDWLPDGRMLIVAGTDRLLLRQEPDGSLTTYADLNEICDRTWNEIVVDTRGNAYVNSIGFDMMAGEDPKPGVIAVVTSDGQARRVADGVMFPNGMAVTADGATLIVAESYGNKLTAFDIEHDGGLSGRRTWAELGAGAPDGICVDAEGAVWYADVPNQHCVRVREGGEVLQTVTVDRGCFACMLGGDDGQTLFIVAAEWPAVMTEGSRTGQVLTAVAPAPHAGRP